MWSPYNPGLVHAMADERARSAEHDGIRRRLVTATEDTPRRHAAWSLTFRRTRPVPQSSG